jgi:hypothetical protein
VKKLASGLALALSLTVGLVSGHATAAPLAFDGRLHIEVGVIGFDVLGSGVATVDSLVNPHHFSIPAGVFSAVGLVSPVPSSLADLNRPIISVQGTVRNGAGAFSKPGASFRGAMPLVGFGKVCLFTPCSSALANVSVPLNVVGVGGSVFAQGPVNVTVAGAPWTADGEVAGVRVGPSGYASTYFVQGFHHGPASHAGSTFQHGGVIQLVTPMYVQTNLPIVTNAYATLTLHFTPEPGTLALLGLGVAALALRGARMRSSRAR